MRTRLFYLSGAAFIGSLIAAACTTTPPVPEPAAPAVEMHVDATIKDLMLGVIDPNADVVWNAVTVVSNADGITETRPRNDEEWATTRRGALALMEGSNLLKMHPRQVAQGHEISEVPGIELEPDEMEANIKKDIPAWDKHAEDLYQASKLVLAAIDAKNVEKVFELGESIEHACEGCHKTYWYPNEKIPDFNFDSLPSTGQSTAPAQKK